MQVLEEYIAERKENRTVVQHEDQPEEQCEEQQNFIAELRNMIREENSVIFKGLDERISKLEEKVTTEEQSNQQPPPTPTATNKKRSRRSHSLVDDRKERKEEEEEQEEKEKVIEDKNLMTESIRAIIREEMGKGDDIGVQNQRQFQRQPPFPRPRRRPMPNCYTCGKVGHIARNCRANRNYRTQGPQRDIDEVDRYRSVEVPRDDGTLRFIPVHYLQNMEIPPRYQQPPPRPQYQQPQPPPAHREYQQHMPYNQTSQNTMYNHHYQSYQRPQTYPSIPPTNF